MKILVTLILSAVVLTVCITNQLLSSSLINSLNQNYFQAIIASTDSKPLVKADEEAPKTQQDFFCPGDKVHLPNCGRPPGTKSRKSSNNGSENRRAQCYPNGNGGHVCVPPQ